MRATARGLGGARRALIAATALAPAMAMAQVTPQEFAERRERLAALVPAGSAVLVLGAPEPVRDYDGFSPAPDLRFLTGWDRPEGAWLVVTDSAGGRTSWFFAPPRSASQEVWTGPRLSLEQVSQATGLPARDMADVRPVVDSLLALKRPLAVIGDFAGPASVLGPTVTRDAGLLREWQARAPGLVTNGMRYAMFARAKKSAAETALLRRAIEITVAAHEEVAASLVAGMHEFEVDALVAFTFRRLGAERAGFASIAGSGDNATTLHYTRNDRRTEPGELMVLDIGAAWQGYSADVTRTYPVSGRFGEAQRRVYQLVRDAQRAAEATIVPGTPYRAASDSASATLARGLTALGLMESPTGTYDCDARGQRQCPQLGLYYMHGLGHPIGLAVHDIDPSAIGGTWREGSVFSIEPGIYVRRNLAEILPKTERNAALLARLAPALATYGGIGVRIEDDYAITPTGIEWLSRAPREIDEVERALAAPRRATPKARDAKAAALYRRSLPDAVTP